METHWTRQPIQQLKWTQTWMGHIFAILGMLGDPPDTKGFIGNGNRSLVSRQIDIVPSGSWSRWRWRTIASWLLRRLTAEQRKHWSFLKRARSKLDTIDFDDFYCFIPSKKMVICRVYPIVRTLLDVLCSLPEGKCLVCRNHSWCFSMPQCRPGHSKPSKASASLLPVLIVTFWQLLMGMDGEGMASQLKHLSTSLNLHWKCTGSSNSRTSTELMDAYILFTYKYILFSLLAPHSTHHWSTSPGTVSG